VFLLLPDVLVCFASFYDRALIMDYSIIEGIKQVPFPSPVVKQDLNWIWLILCW